MQRINICLFFKGSSRGWKKESFMEIAITELIFVQVSITLNNYLIFILTRFAICPRREFNTPKKLKFKDLQAIHNRQKRSNI